MGRQIYQAIVDGILGGGIYALMAVGLTLIFGVLDIINIAQGILVVLGAYLSYALSVHLHIDLFVGLLITVPVMFVIGVTIQVLFMRPLRGRERTSMSLLAAYAVALIIEGILYRVFGPDYVVLKAPYITSSIYVFGFYLPYIYLYGFALAVACVVAIYLILYRTRFGRSVRATMQDQVAARLVGIDVNRVAAVTFGIGVAVTAVGGMMFGATSGGFNPNSGYDLISRLLAIIILGGLGSIGGALVAAVLMTTAEALVDIWSPDWAVVVFYLVLVLVLVFRPAGLFRPAHGEGPMSDSPGTWRRLASAAWRPGGALVVLAIFAVFPLVATNATVTTIAVDTLIFAASAVAWNIFSGYSGYISLGQAVFFGTGVYVVGIAARAWHLTGDTVFALLPLAGALAGVLAVPLGLIALRVRRHTFVVITIAFFFIAQLTATNLSVTGGSSGILAPSPNWDPATFNNPFYYIALALLVVATVASWLIRRSRFGLQLRAIRDDEDRAAGLGVRAMPVKLTAFVISAVVTGMAGGLWFYFIGQALPQFAFDPLFDLSVVVMAFLGGLGTVAGPILGALIIEPAQQWLTLQYTNEYLSEILLGALFLLVILFLPRGVIPTGSELITKFRARLRSRRADAGETPPGSPGPAPAATKAGTGAPDTGTGAGAPGTGTGAGAPGAEAGTAARETRP